MVGDLDCCSTTFLMASWVARASTSQLCRSLMLEVSRLHSRSFQTLQAEKLLASSSHGNCGMLSSASLTLVAMETACL